MIHSENIIEQAAEFAKKAHKTQVRKYTGEPYFNHCHEVAMIVAAAGGSPEMIAAAYLHDTIEDTETTFMEIRDAFGNQVASLVLDLTDVSKPSDGNRTVRKEIDRKHTANASKDAKTIKLADLISNSKSIVKHDKNFAIVYLKEKELLLDELTQADPDLFEKACDLLIQCKLELRGA